MSRGKMRAPSFVKSVSSKLSLTRRFASPIVAPLPEQSRFSEEVTTSLDGLHKSVERDCGISSSWLVDVFDATIASQVVAQEMLSGNDLVSLSATGRKMIDDYLEDNVELLDVCNGMVEKISMIQKYIDILGKTSTLIRKQELSKECRKLEGDCATLDKCSPKLNRLMGQNAAQMSNVREEKLHEVLSGSKEIASMGCHLLQRALSFKSRQGSMKMKSKLPTTWSSSLNGLQIKINEIAEKRKKGAPWMMKELELMVMEANMLHDQMNSQTRDVGIVSLKRSCDVLEGGIISLEERIRELYKHLISIRMTLLGVLSQN